MGRCRHSAFAAVLVIIAQFAATKAEDCKVISAAITEKDLFASPTTQNVDNIIDKNVTTSATESEWVVVQLQNSSSSEFLCVKKLVLTPARPPANIKAATGGGDKKDTEKCIFPFKKDNIDQYRCIDSGFGYLRCSYDKHVEISDWSSCASAQPDGSTADNVDVTLSSSSSFDPLFPMWNDFEASLCGDTGSGLYNAPRTVDCSSVMLNAKYLALKKLSNMMQFAEISIEMSKAEQKLKIAKVEGRSLTLEIDGCTLPCSIQEIVWYHRNIVIGRTKSSERNFTVEQCGCGNYHFEFVNVRKESIFKSEYVTVPPACCLNTTSTSESPLTKTASSSESPSTKTASSSESSLTTAQDGKSPLKTPLLQIWQIVMIACGALIVALPCCVIVISWKCKKAKYVPEDNEANHVKTNEEMKATKTEPENEQKADPEAEDEEAQKSVPELVEEYTMISSNL